METMDNNTISSTHQEKAKKMRKLRRWQIIVSLFGVAVIVWGVIEIVFLFLGYKQTETSNDAQIEQYVSPVNLRASGYINKIYFTEHQQVRKGDTLLVLDDREYKIRVMEAEAALKDADGLLAWCRLEFRNLGTLFCSAADSGEDMASGNP